MMFDFNNMFINKSRFFLVYCSYLQIIFRIMFFKSSYKDDLKLSLQKYYQCFSFWTKLFMFHIELVYSLNV